MLFAKDGLNSIEHRKQLKVIMNLPVRIIADNQIMDVLPLEVDQLGVVGIKKRRYKYLNPNFINATADEMIAFFSPLKPGDLMTRRQVCNYYNVGVTTISTWSRLGIIHVYRFSLNLSFYKVCELPSLEQIYQLQQK